MMAELPHERQDRAGMARRRGAVCATAGGLLVLALITRLGAYLRLANLRYAPSWYPDEGSNIVHAASFAQGPYQYLAINGTPILAGRMPLCMLALG